MDEHTARISRIYHALHDVHFVTPRGAYGPRLTRWLSAMNWPARYEGCPDVAVRYIKGALIVETLTGAVMSRLDGDLESILVDVAAFAARVSPGVAPAPPVADPSSLGRDRPGRSVSFALPGSPEPARTQPDNRASQGKMTLASPPSSINVSRNRMSAPHAADEKPKLAPTSVSSRRMADLMLSSAPAGNLGMGRSG